MRKVRVNFGNPPERQDWSAVLGHLRIGESVDLPVKNQRDERLMRVGARQAAIIRGMKVTIRKVKDNQLRCWRIDDNKLSKEMKSWGEMMVGQSFLVPVGYPEQRLRWSAAQAAKRFKSRRFRVKREYNVEGYFIGYRCWRVE